MTNKKIGKTGNYVMFLIFAIFLTSCGQTGPLYLPKNSKSQQTLQSQPEDQIPVPVVEQVSMALT